MVSEEFEKKKIWTKTTSIENVRRRQVYGNMRKATEKVRQKEMKAENMRSEIERIKRKESSQEGGLTHVGKCNKCTKTKPRLSCFKEHIDS